MQDAGNLTTPSSYAVRALRKDIEDYYSWTNSRKHIEDILPMKVRKPAIVLQ